MRNSLIDKVFFIGNRKRLLAKLGSLSLAVINSNLTNINTQNQTHKINLSTFTTYIFKHYRSLFSVLP